MIKCKVTRMMQVLECCLFGVSGGWHWMDAREGTAGRTALCQAGSFPPEKRSPFGFGSGW